MRRRSSQLGVAALVLLFAAPAWADWYESKKDERSGVTVGFALGGAVVKGLGDFKNVGGLGPTASLRIGTVAGPKLLWLFTIDNANYLIEDQFTEKVTTNQSVSVTVGGQYYVRDALWGRLGIGPGWFLRRANEGDSPEETHGGFGFSSGVGVDVWFRKKWVINLEVVFTASIVSGGLVSHGGLMMALTRY